MKLRLALIPLMAVAAILLNSYCTDIKAKAEGGTEIDNEMPLKSKYFGVDRDNIGVVNGKVISFYGHQGNGVWTKSPNNTFTIPAEAKDVFTFGSNIGVYKSSGRVDIYKNLAPGKWGLVESEHSGGFDAPKGCDRVVAMGTEGIGFVKGDTIKIYVYRKPMPAFDFIAPKGSTEIFTAGGAGIMVASPKGLDLYRMNKDTQWAVVPVAHFDFPKDKKGFMPIYADPCFGLVKADGVDIYFVRDDRKPMYEKTFKLPK